jgi:hypothetical protein
MAAAHLIGPLVYRTTLQAAPVPDSLLTAVIDSVADWRPPDPARSRPTSAPGQPRGQHPGDQCGGPGVTGRETAAGLVKPGFPVPKNDFGTVEEERADQLLKATAGGTDGGSGRYRRSGS